MRYFLSFIYILASTMLMAQPFHTNKVIAHRGAWKASGHPQNSIASLRQAIDNQYFASEFDVRMTKDNVLVIIHDPDHQNLDVEKHTYKQLSAIRLKNEEILPTLEQYLGKGLSQSKTKLILEIKASPQGEKRSVSMAKKTVALVKKMKATHFVDYICFDLAILRQIRKSDPKAHTEYLTGDLSPAQIKAEGFSGVDYHYTVFQKNPTWLGECQRLGLSTNAWTVNDAETMRYLLLQGIDHITTDEPELMTRIEKEIGDQRRELLWSDEFLYTGLPDKSIWTYDVGGHGFGNQELQYYTKADTNNAYVSQGTLKITAHKMPYEERDYTSARLMTFGLKDILHGRVDVRAKLPQGRGTWPAIWTLGQNRKEVGWPNCGEIDIMEHVGYDADTIHASTHSVEHNHIKKTQKTNQVKILDPYTQFHVFSVEYSDQKMTFFLDNEPYYSIQRSECKDWPFDHAHYLILNIAVGGFWGGAQGIDDSIWPQTMEVDYVRVWK